MNRLRTASILFLLALLSLACGSEKSFTITGQIIGGGNDSLSIEEMGDRSLNTIQSIVTDQDGNFSFTDTAANPRFLFLKTKNEEYLSFLVLNGQDIKMSVNLLDINGSYTVAGSSESELIWSLNKSMQAATLKLDSLARIYQAQKESGEDSIADDWFSRKYSELLTDQKDYIIQFINEHYASPASLMALSHQINGQTVLNPQTDFAYFEKVDAALSEQYPESQIVATLHNWVLGYQQQQAITSAQNNSVGIGAEAPEISLPNPEGKTISLSSLRGKYVLLDFWAAWCSPCRRENPTLVRAYNKYNSKGFEIFQVSLDKTKEDWTQAIQTDKLAWTHVSDLKYWGSPVAKLYYVQSIPANFLLDQDGKIIAKNLRGPALEQKLAEIFQ